MKRENNKTIINHSCLERELDWFTIALEVRFKNYFNQSELADFPVPPNLENDESDFAQMVLQNGFGTAERLVLGLALAPHLRPHILDLFFTKNPQLDRPFTEFGGYIGKDHAGFLPTGETAAFLVAPELHERLKLGAMFSPKHPFAVEQILQLERADASEPFLSGRLRINEAFFHKLTTGEQYTPASTDFFPAKRITTTLEWEDLVVSPAVMTELMELKTWIEHQDQLMADPVFSKMVKPGFRSLFYGPAGTGKKLAASLIGKAGKHDVYRVDLSLIVSKYIGETEKNLARIFDYAEKQHWILFFDEADALFGKRTQINSSNDRFANQEIAFLLQRIEDFSGIVIMAANQKSNIDAAFSRRFQSMIHFPLPDRSQRLRLWKNIFNCRIKPAADVDFNQLAEDYELSGGSIINILQSCTLKAIQEKSHEISKKNIIEAIRKEYQKRGK
ncbi:MAG: ATP-binding protein [Saprospiraceae bacterium]